MRCAATGEVAKPPKGGCSACSSFSVALRSTGSFASAARDVTAEIGAFQVRRSARRVRRCMAEILGQPREQRALALLRITRFQLIVVLVAHGPATPDFMPASACAVCSA